MPYSEERLSDLSEEMRYDAWREREAQEERRRNGEATDAALSDLEAAVRKFCARMIEQKKADVVERVSGANPLRQFTAKNAAKWEQDLVDVVREVGVEALTVEAGCDLSFARGR